MYRSVFTLFSSMFKMLANLLSTFKLDKNNLVLDECRQIRTKMKDLYTTNLKLGLYHMYEGNLNDALFRFWIMNKFYKNSVEILYNLGRCYLLKNKKRKAAEAFRKGLTIDNNNKEILYQLQKINSDYPSIKEVPINLISEYFDYAASSFAKLLIAKKYIAVEIAYKAIEAAFSNKKLLKLRILDLACGTGICLQFLKMAGIGEYFVGVDISKRMSEIARQCKANGNTVFQRVKKQNMYDFLDQNTEKYNVILLTECLHYKKDLSTFLKKASNALEKSGLILILVRESENWDIEFSCTGDCFLFSEAYLRRELQKANLELTSLLRCKLYDDSLKGMFAVAKYEHKK